MTKSHGLKKLVEFRSYTLKPGTRPGFHERFVQQSVPMLRRFGIDTVAYGPSAQDETSYFLIRAFATLQERERSEDAFYGSDEWRNGPRAAVLADIESYTTFVLTLDEELVNGLRGANPLEATMQRNESASADRDRLLQLNEGYIAAYLKADVEWYRQHLAEDFVCIESDGRVLDKTSFLTNCAKGPDVATYKLAETTIRIYGDTGIVQARGLFTRPDGSTGTSRYTDIWVRTAKDGWKTVSAQITRSAR